MNRFAPVPAILSGEMFQLNQRQSVPCGRTTVRMHLLLSGLAAVLIAGCCLSAVSLDLPGEDLPPTMFGLEQNGPDDWPFFKHARDRMDDSGLPKYTWKLSLGAWLGWQGGEFRRDPVFVPSPIPGDPPIIDFDGIEDLPTETNLLPYVNISLRPFRNHPIHELNLEYTEARFKPAPQTGRGVLAGQSLMVWYRMRLIRAPWLEAGVEFGWSFFYAKARLLTDVDAFGQPIIQDLVKRIHNPVIGISGRIPFSDTVHFIYAGRGNPVDIGTRILRTSGGFDWQLSQNVGVQLTYEYLWLEFYEDFLYVKTTVHGPMLALTISY